MSKSKKHKIFKEIKKRMSGEDTKEKRGISIYFHALLLVVIIFGFGIYLFQVNESSTQGFKIRTLERNVEQLESIQRELQMRQAEINSLSVLHERADDLQLVAVDRVQSLTDTGDLALGE